MPERRNEFLDRILKSRASKATGGARQGGKSKTRSILDKLGITCRRERMHSALDELHEDARTGMFQNITDEQIADAERIVAAEDESSARPLISRKPRVAVLCLSRSMFQQFIRSQCEIETLVSGTGNDQSFETTRATYYQCMEMDHVRCNVFAEYLCIGTFDPFDLREQMVEYLRLRGARTREEITGMSTQASEAFESQEAVESRIRDMQPLQSLYEDVMDRIHSSPGATLQVNGIPIGEIQNNPQITPLPDDFWTVYRARIEALLSADWQEIMRAQLAGVSAVPETALARPRPPQGGSGVPVSAQPIPEASQDVAASVAASNALAEVVLRRLGRRIAPNPALLQKRNKQNG